ncbi:24927_t:CDS:2 [Cetraspora pellucida]|uniref:24927_t:CDS:1 n=1 Tax=Cetraspora pellucida TaxID=1433469 RepID=A0A9N9HJF2_9GLOM|nr:24927_t:CDS:2 [Cetraspora pellucida]
MFGNETTSYKSESCNKSNNHNFDNIDTFILDKISFDKARIFAENEEICYNTFLKKDDEFEVNSAFSTEIESISTLSCNESIELQDDNSICIVGKNVQSDSEHRTRYICSQCFNKHDSHFYKHIGSRKNHSFFYKENYTNDITEMLQVFGNWILQTATMEVQHSMKLVNFFLLKIIFKIGQVDLFTHSNKCFGFMPETSKKLLYYILSSLSHKPKMMSSLYAILYLAGVISHSQNYEYQLEKICLNESKSENRLIREKNV